MTLLSAVKQFAVRGCGAVSRICVSSFVDVHVTSLTHTHGIKADGFPVSRRQQVANSGRQLLLFIANANVENDFRENFKPKDDIMSLLCSRD